MRGNIKNIIKKLIKQYDFNNLYDLAQCLDVDIIETELKNTLGMYRYIKRNKFIFLNINLDEITKRFVLAHELGHAILHTKNNCFYLKHNTFVKTNCFEVEANKFAAEILIDDEELEICLKNGYTVEQIASYFQVLPELVEYKFK